MASYPIVDSHIHLYPESHIKSLAWAGDLPDNHELNQQRSVDQYRKASSAASGQLKGFIFLETDRITEPLSAEWLSGSSNEADEPPEWKHVLDEISFLSRIGSGQPIEGEGHVPSDSNLMLGFIPWAPVTAGPQVLSRYHDLTLSRCDFPSITKRLRGYRYLFQDKPQGTMLNSEVISSLLWLGSQNLTFDLGVDARQGGLHQLEEAVELLSRLQSSSSDQKSLPKIIINHLCKPNLRLPSSSLPSHPDFQTWKQLITKMSQYPESYMKLSGLFSELPSQSPTSPPEISALLEQIKPWTDVIFATFGAKRVMFGSDWPVCNVGGPGGEKSWGRWKDVVVAVLEDSGLEEGEREWVWARTAMEGYGIQVN